MSWTLLTNDDGMESPALPAFARALVARNDVRIVVPDRERSWVGKAITRFEPIAVTDVVRHGVAMKACSGYPADAVQLGIDGLFDTRPELVLSGINLGYNHGAGFLVSSGTVGAAIEGWVSGINSIAFSTGSNADDWNAWRAWALSDAALDSWDRLGGLCAVLTEDIAGSGVFDEADVVSVNVPFDATGDTARRTTSIARVGYDRLFRNVGDGTFVHDFGGGIRQFGGLNGSDVAAAKDGVVSITPIRMPAAADLTAGIRARLEDRHVDDPAPQ